MFTMKAFKYVIQFWFSFLMVIVVVPVFSLIYAGRIPFPGILLDMLTGFIAGNVIVNVIGLFLPVQKLAERFVGLFNAKTGTFAYNLLATFVYVSIYVVIFGCLYTALAIGFPPYYFPVVLKGMPLSFAVCYVVGVAINPIALKLSFWTCGGSAEKSCLWKVKMKKMIKLLPLFGAAGVVFYFLHVLLGTLFYPGYDSAAQAISDLTASNSPSKNIAMPFTVMYGVFTVIFAAYFLVYFKQKINKCVTFGAGVFCAMTIVSFLGYTFFPLSESGYAGTFQDKMHLVVTIVVVLFTIMALISFVIGFFKTEKLKYLAIISLCTFLLLLTGSMLMNILPQAYFGIAERINVFSIVIYTGILSFWMDQYLKKTP